MAQEINLTKRLTIDEIINHSIKLYGKNFLPFILVAAVPLIPAYVFLTLFSRKLMVAIQALSANVETAGVEGLVQIFRSLGQYSVGMLVYGVLLVFGMAAMIKAASDAVTGTQPSAGAVLNHVLSRFFPILLTSVIAFVIIMIGSPLFFIPSIILAVYLSFIFQTAVIDDRFYFRAVGRSFQLVKGHFWSIFLLVFIYWIVYSLVSNAVTWGFMMGPYIDFIKHLVQDGGQSDPVVMTAFYSKLTGIMVPVYAFTGALNILLYPLLLTALTLKFHNIRSLKEGTGMADKVGQGQDPIDETGK